MTSSGIELEQLWRLPGWTTCRPQIRLPRNSDLDATTTHNSHHDTPTSSSAAAVLPYYAPPTYASFSPAHLATASSAAKRRSTILVHQKSPLLLVTPPQVIRALAYSHLFLLPLNKLAGLLTWTTGDPWESFLLLVAFWAAVLYGDILVRLAGPIVTVLALIGGMYSRRYSPLSSSGWAEHPSNLNSHTGGLGSSGNTNNNKSKGGKNSAGGAGDPASTTGHTRAGSEATSTRHQKTLDEIVETLKVFTTRCNILLEPLLEMTDFLSTSRTATSATTRPALTTLFVRLLAITPLWIALMLPPWRIITTKRVALIVGTILLAAVRQIAGWITGLEFDRPTIAATSAAANAHNGSSTSLSSSKKHPSNAASALTAALQRGRRRPQSKDPGVRFTFILYENQRRWVALGWTSSLFTYERAAWTDEQNNPLPSKDAFELPEVEDAPAKWRWVEGSRWRVDGVPDPEVTDYDTEAGKMGWIYYDNKGSGSLASSPEVERSKTFHHNDSNNDAAGSSTASTKSRFRFPTPTLRRRATGGSVSNHQQQSSTSSHTNDNSTGTGSGSGGKGSGNSSSSRPRRTSNASSLGRTERDYTDDDSGFGSLTPALEFEIQGHHKELGSWGVGDDVQMGLE
ncbi:integral peroxisomal membrane peroxin-domain-containing protein [Microdochium trichocladiopsis]|uniref:Integral peroxisomal membrane peroxin-domain-containing protein n=1 Tax=Microdochium trichocladiopsis TaxID=1682393 RepID=A0A9P9BTB3_9PEZI|nr:integral peroxisomal membrane peroxin-domain-containing protein [Microdochium trichocladiopsis]KAH7029666.1 integral peroxisomal membrane peroxin-domain-containing protein [Microdochium trichocladiopsis]